VKRVLVPHFSSPLSGPWIVAEFGAQGREPLADFMSDCFDVFGCEPHDRAIMHGAGGAQEPRLTLDGTPSDVGESGLCERTKEGAEQQQRGEAIKPAGAVLRSERAVVGVEQE
jgi:hypothetical protein